MPYRSGYNLRETIVSFDVARPIVSHLSHGAMQGTHRPSYRRFSYFSRDGCYIFSTPWFRCQLEMRSRNNSVSFSLSLSLSFSLSLLPSLWRNMHCMYAQENQLIASVGKLTSENFNRFFSLPDRCIARSISRLVSKATGERSIQPLMESRDSASLPGLSVACLREM